jgi:glycosyltransferase involved in cell wall biosynthesis
MRLLLVNLSSRRIAGTEIYLEELANEIAQHGVETALLAESGEPAQRPQIALPAQAPHFSRMEDAVAWRPSVVLANGRVRADWETEILRRWPSAYFIHNYYGTCISGLKRHQYPRPEPCFRRLGPACLGLYPVRGCGGKNPLTMFQLYRRETAQLERLRGYRLLITHSEAMREEYLRHDFPASRISVIPFACVPEGEVPAAPDPPVDSSPRRLFFAGRMEAVKGGAELIAAAAALAGRHPVELTLAGAGERLELWKTLAQRSMAGAPGLRVHFPGWLTGPMLEDFYRTQHLFVMPSLWPEPFGKGGMEAARFGCPSVGYALGGIPQWLQEGFNGHLADWRGDCVANLAAALERAFASPEHYRNLRTGARAKARDFTAAVHVRHLLPLLTDLGAGA